MSSISLNKCCILLIGPFISFCIILLCLYICVIRVTFFGPLYCKESNVCLGGTCLLVKSTTWYFSYVVNLPTMEWPSNLSSKPCLWTPHFTPTFHPDQSFVGVDLILNGHIYFLVALCVHRLYPCISHLYHNQITLCCFSHLTCFGI